MIIIVIIIIMNVAPTDIDIILSLVYFVTSKKAIDESTASSINQIALMLFGPRVPCACL